tara:strand:+ start:266 stop:385 length:120 start_codon:yes stop_codon:yes gene_type:complete
MHLEWGLNVYIVALKNKEINDNFLETILRNSEDMDQLHL